MTVHHGLRAAAGNVSGVSAIYSNPYFDYSHHNYGGYARGLASVIWTHSGTPVSGNADTGWTASILSGSHTVNSTSWQNKTINLSAHIGKWAIFGFQYEQPSYWMADHIWDNIRYRDSGGSVNLPYTTNTAQSWIDLWAGYDGVNQNIHTHGYIWPLMSAHQQYRYNLTNSNNQFGRWNVYNNSTPSGTTGNVGTGNGYFVYHESSSTNGYNSTDNNNYRFLITKHAYFIGNSQATPILYTP